MQRLFEDIKGSDAVAEFVSRASRGENLLVEGLWNSVQALLAALLVHPGQRNVLYIARSQRDAEVIYDDIGAFKKGAAHLFPSWETLPHEKVAPHPEIVSDRFSVLKRLLDAGAGRTPFVVVTSVQGILQKVISAERLRRLLFTVTVGEEVKMEEILNRVVSLSYEREEMVERKGTFSVRGGIVDIFPITDSLPVRLEFFGDTVESIREFDPTTQRSMRRADYVTILPADEIALNTQYSRELSTVLDYLDKTTTTLIYDEPAEIEKRADELQAPIPEEAEEFVRLSDFNRQAREWPKIFFRDLPLATAGDIGASRLAVRVKPLTSLGKVRLVAEVPEEARVEVFSAIPDWLKDNRRIYFVCNKPGEEERLRGLLAEKGIAVGPNMRFASGQLSSGFFLEEMNVVVVPDNEIFNRYKIRRAPRQFTSTAPIRDFEELSKGDYVVHVDHGIGRFQGIVTLKEHDPNKEFLAVEYADEAKLYVPVAQAHLVSKYIGPTKRAPALDVLGGNRWPRRKRRVELAIRDYAGELLELYAARQSAEGTAFSADTEWQREFEDAFIYEETPDQVKALEELKRDMETPRPMDRLICGDVGYGKTEVAIRAAFKAVMDGKQVAVLVPTTVLAQQHYHTFRERMADYPVNTEVLSRFKKPSQQKEIVGNLKAGKVDIVIGTHRLIQNDVGFRNIGLVVIDEEQRFGVKHKEKLKQLRRMVDVLTMSATPIPRTLYMSLVGARDMSTIDTPPLDRLPVKTILAEFDPELIRSAILRELNRDGQVYFLHNRVQTIEKMTEYLQKLVPEGTIMAAHGQMDEGELETIMEHFINGSIDVLVCTTIIESGLDIPNANTIIIDRADRFGLADLYQLRGRVGRWKHQAYAYLMVPRGREILETARKRLKALLDAQGLGAGFQIAMKDLEMRGAGNILGTEQHGHIAAVGFTLYCQLLKRTIERLKGKQIPDEIEVTIKVDLGAHIPKKYVPGEKQRIDLYKRLSGAFDEGEIQAIAEEMVDRFGPLPEEARNLVEIARLKIWAKNEKINRIEVSDGKIIAERSGRKLMLEGRFPRLKPSEGRKVLHEIRRSLERILRAVA